MSTLTITDPSGRTLGYGDPSVATTIISSAKKILLLSDSTWNRNLEPTKRPFLRSNRTKSVKLYQPSGFGGGFFAAWGGDSYLTGIPVNYSPYAGSYEYPMPSTAFPAGNLWFENRVAQWIFSDGVIVGSGATPQAADNCGSFSGSILQQSKTQGARVTLEVWAGPHGDPLNNLQMVVLNGAQSLLGTSATFNCHAASNQIRTITVDVASWTGEEIIVAVRGLSEAATTTGRHFVSLSIKLEVLATVATNLTFDCISYGSEHVTTYLDTNRLSNAAWSVINSLNYDAVVIALGINGYEVASEASWRASYSQLINKIRATNATLPICATTQLPIATLASTMDSLRLVVDQHENMLAIDTARQFPVFSMMTKGFTNQWVSGTFYSLGDMVQHSGTIYQHKVLNPAVSTVSPDTDTTNWNAVGTSLNNDVFLVNSTRNRILGDGAHPHAFGRMIYSSIFWSSLESCAAYDYGSNFLSSRLEETYEQARIAAQNTQS